MQNKIEFNYYQLKLLSYLLESHPALASDIGFIKARARLAAQAEEQALLQDYTPQGAEEISCKVLFEGLHFSTRDTIKNILTKKFTEIIPPENVNAFTILIQSDCEAVFAKYRPHDDNGNRLSFPDDFASEAAFDELENELTTIIKSLMKQYGIQQKSASR